MIQKAFVFVVFLLFSCNALALEISAPNAVSTNAAFAVIIEFDSLNSFNEAIVELEGATILRLQTIGDKLFVDTVAYNKVLNLKKNEVIEGSTLPVLLNGISSAKEIGFSVEEVGKTKENASITIYEAASSAQIAENNRKSTNIANNLSDLEGTVNGINSALETASSVSSQLKDSVSEITGTINRIKDDILSKASEDKVNNLAQSVEDHQARLFEMQEKSDKLTSAGFISFGSIQEDPRLAGYAAIAIIAVIAILIAKGKVKLPKMPKLKLGRGKSIYNPSREDAEITSQVLEDKAGNEPKAPGKWAFSKGGWQAKEETKDAPSGLGSLIRRN